MNYRLLREINGWSGGHLADAAMRFAAADLIFAAFAVFGLLCVASLRRREVRAVVLAGAALALAYVLGLLAAEVHGERRPFTAHPDIRLLVPHAAGQSFPSDHATAAFALAFAALAFLSRRWGAALLAAACLVAFARVYVGVHYPGDVLGSAVVAGLAVLAVGTASASPSARKTSPAHDRRAARGNAP